MILAFFALILSVVLSLPWFNNDTNLIYWNAAIARFDAPQEPISMSDQHQLEQADVSAPDTPYLSVIETARNAWLEGDADTFADLFTTSGQMIVPGQSWTGRDPIRAAMNDYSNNFSVISIDIKHKIVQGHHASVEWSWHDMERETGRQSRADDVIILTFQDDLIAQWREYIDRETPKTQHDSHESLEPDT